YRPRSRATLFPYTTLFRSLHASVDEQLKRTSRSHNRPLLKAADPRAVLESLMTARRPLYEEAADLCMDTTGRQVAAVMSDSSTRSEEHTSELQSRENLVCR